QIETLAHAFAQDRFTKLRHTAHRNTAAGHAEPVFDWTRASVRGHDPKRWVAVRVKSVKVFVGDDYDGVHTSPDQRLAQRAKTLLKLLPDRGSKPVWCRQQRRDVDRSHSRDEVSHTVLQACRALLSCGDTPVSLHHERRTLLCSAAVSGCVPDLLGVRAHVVTDA